MQLPEGQSLDPRVVNLWRLQRLIRLMLFGLPFSVAVGVGLGIALNLWAGVAAGLLLGLFYLINAMVWPALEYEHYRYWVREQDLLVQQGVLFRHWSAVPLNRIQYVDLRQGPLERTFGLMRLLVYTAAGMSADASIPGLAQAEAEPLRDSLSRRGGDDGV